MTLEEILQVSFKCKKPFLKRKRIVGYNHGEPDYEYMTKAGANVYENMISFIFSLESLLGKEFSSSRWVEKLDEIVREEY
ncbi:MAG: hypothetical protein LBC86_05765 [Oscillospiraceae bacterium]|jgi:hypothetical protein|nr:hypothetical protein [Oscillospiraceae bacterium]